MSDNVISSVAKRTNERTVESILAALRAAADRAEAGWLPGTARLQADGRWDELTVSQRDVQLRTVGIVEGFPSAPDRTVALDFDLTLPEAVDTVAVAGEPLELTVNSIYPTRVIADGVELFDDAFPVVASGPAAVTAVPRSRAGGNGVLRIEIRTGRINAIGPLSDLAFTLHFTTPALRDRFYALDLAWARLALAHALCAGDDDRDLVQRVAQALPDPGRPLADLATALDTLADDLAPVLDRSRRYRVWCVGHSHIDLSWMWDWGDAQEVVKRDVRSALDLMDDYPQFRFTHSQPAGYRAVAEDDPELFERIRRQVAAGRWEAATMQWVEADSNLTSGPAAARQLVEGVRWTEQNLGVRPRTLLAPDTFGHAGNLPQMAVAAGADVYYHHRGNPGAVAGGTLWPAYWWEGVDGTRILAVSTQAYLGPLTAGRVVRDLISQGIDAGLREVCYFYGVGDHGGGPTRLDLDTLVRLAGEAGLPEMRCGTVGEYADAVVAVGDELPVHRGESMTVFEGCYVSHADAKRANRNGENALVAAQSLAAVAGLPADDRLVEPWRSVLFAQFHDIVCGSSARPVYDDLAQSTKDVLAAAAEVEADALDVLESGVPVGDWAVTNPTGHDRVDAVSFPAQLADRLVAHLAADNGSVCTAQRAADGTFVAVLPVPSFGTRALRVLGDGDVADQPGAIGLVTEPSISYSGAEYFVVDTPHFLVRLRRDCGVITTLYDKRADRELVGYAGARARNAEQVRPDVGLGVLQVLDEWPHTMTSWVVDELHTETSLIRGAVTEVAEHGPVRLVLRTTHRVRSSTVEVDTTFYADLARIDYRIRIDWKEIGGPDTGVPSLAICFATRHPNPQAWYETPFAAATRPVDGLLVPALRWADIGDDSHGLAVLNDGKYGYEALGSRLRIRLVRGSYDPDPLGDLGVDESRFTLLPHDGSWRDAGITAAAAQRNHPLHVRQVERERTASRPSRRLRLDGDPNVVVTDAVAMADGVQVRLNETTGRPGTVHLDGARVSLRPFEVRVVTLAPGSPSLT